MFRSWENQTTPLSVDDMNVVSCIGLVKVKAFLRKACDDGIGVKVGRDYVP